MKKLLYILTLSTIMVISGCGDDDEFDFVATNQVGFVTTTTNITEIQAEDSITIDLLVNPAKASSVSISIDGDELVYGENFTTVPAASNGSLTLQVAADGTASFKFVGSDIDITKNNTVIFTITAATGAELGQSAVVSHRLNIERIFLFKEDFNDCETSFPSGWITFSKASNANWECSDNLRGASGQSGDYAASIYGVGADVASADWLISPVINLDEDSDYVLQFASIKRFEGPELQVLISNDYSGSGDPTTATWVNFSAAEAALDQTIDFDYEASGEITIPLSGSVFVAFFYETNGTAIGDGSNYRIDNVRVKRGLGFGGEIVSIPFTEDFSGCDELNSFTSYSVVGEGQVWNCSANGEDGDGVRMNGFSGSPQNNEDWLLSPGVNLTEDATLSFSTDVRFGGPELEVLISTNYAGLGDPNAADWTAISATLDTDDSSYDTWVGSGDIDLSAYTGQTVVIAFKYTSNSTDGAAAWTVDNFNVQ